MTLFDIDSGSVDRGAPNPNHHDKVTPEAIKAHGTDSTNYQTDASTASLISGAKNGQFTIVQSDFITTSSLTLLAASPGAGVFAQFRAIPVASVTHNLPFIPTMTGSVLSITGNTYMQMPHGDADYSAPTTSALWYTLSFSADATKIYVQAHGMVWGGGWSFPPGWVFKYFAQYQTSN